MPEPIDYASSETTRRTERVWPARLLLAAVVFLAITVIVGEVGRYDDVGWVCAVCASSRGEKEWRLGFTTSRRMRLTSLDGWIAKHQGGHAHDWRNVRGWSTNIFGSNFGSGHGRAPPIMDLLSGGNTPLVNYYISATPDQEIAEFVRIMQHGTEVEQESAVEAAADRALDAMRAAP